MEHSIQTQPWIHKYIYYKKKYVFQRCNMWKMKDKKFRIFGRITSVYFDLDVENDDDAHSGYFQPFIRQFHFYPSLLFFFFLSACLRFLINSQPWKFSCVEEAPRVWWWGCWFASQFSCHCLNYTGNKKRRVTQSTYFEI